MKIVDIKVENGREVAYVFDEKGGRLIKLLVEDYTGGFAEVEEEIPPVRRTVRRRTVPAVDYRDEVDELNEVPPKIEKPQLPRKAPPNIMPPGIRSIFTPEGQPGAAVETRRI